MDLGEGFTLREGQVIKRMPELRAARERPISLDMTLEMQYIHPDTWGKIYVFTGDAVLTGRDGNAVIDKDSALLYTVDGNSKLQNNALVLSDDEYETVRYRSGVAHLSPAELERAHGKGFVKVRGVWQPENRTVGYVWDVLTGRDLKDHAELASQRSNGAAQVMCLFFDQGKRSEATLRPWVVDSLDYGSDADGDEDLLNDSGRLVGAAPEALVARSAGRDPAWLRARLEIGLESYVAPATLTNVVEYATKEALRFADRK